VIDPDGYRPNVGIILMRDDGHVFWARRAYRDGWQFPQGGMRSDETPLEAMYRELQEETGLRPEHVQVLGATPGWLRYKLPRRYRPPRSHRNTRIRSVALGRFLVSHGSRRRVQAGSVRTCPAAFGSIGRRITRHRPRDRKSGHPLNDRQRS